MENNDIPKGPNKSPYVKHVVREKVDIQQMFAEMSEDELSPEVKQFFDLQRVAKAKGLDAGEIRELLDRVVGCNSETSLELFVTSDTRMLLLKEKVRKVAPARAPVLITGDSGTGKELIARGLHGKREGPFLPLNCAAQNDSLLPSILFGHEKGAFTGAEAAKLGIFRQAKKGTVFLDEIGSMPLQMQSILLRTIQENTVLPVGGTQEERISCRFIAATKYDLEKRVQEGSFLEDLYARLRIFEFHITPLKERPDDIPMITKSLGFLGPIPDKAMADIVRFNVRGIQAFVERMVTLGEY